MAVHRAHRHEEVPRRAVRDGQAHARRRPALGSSVLLHQPPTYQIRILYFDGTGYAIWAKRLERGLFVATHDGETKESLSFAELQCLLEGIEVRGARKYKRFSLPARQAPDARPV